MLKDHGINIKGKTAVISGSGNVAIYACEKAQQLGAKVLAMSDSGGYVYAPDGINIEIMKIKEVDRERIEEYLKYDPSAHYCDNCKDI